MLPQMAGDKAATAAFIGGFIGSVPLEKVFPAQLLQRFADDVARGQQEMRDAA